MSNILHIETAGEAETLGLENWIGTMGKKPGFAKEVKTRKQAEAWLRKVVGGQTTGRYATFPVRSHTGEHLGYGATQL